MFLFVKRAAAVPRLETWVLARFRCAFLSQNPCKPRRHCKLGLVWVNGRIEAGKIARRRAGGVTGGQSAARGRLTRAGRSSNFSAACGQNAHRFLGDEWRMFGTFRRKNYRNRPLAGDLRRRGAAAEARRGEGGVWGGCSGI